MSERREVLELVALLVLHRYVPEDLEEAQVRIEKRPGERLRGAPPRLFHLHRDEGEEPVRRLNSLASRSIAFVVRKLTHSPAGNAR